MNEMKPTANELINKFMKREQIVTLSMEEQSAVYYALHEIVTTAQRQVVDDAKRQIENLYTFSVGR